MRKFLLLLLVSLSSFIDIYGWDGVDFGVEGRVSYFRPFSHRVREIYGNGWANYEIQLTQTFCNDWTIWEGISGWPVDGHSTCLHNKTSMNFWAIRLGGQRQFCLTENLQAYLGVGASYNYLYIHDKSHFVKKQFSKDTFGAIVQTGIYYFLNPNFFFDLNFEYQYQDFHFSKERHSRLPRRDVDLSGIKVGGGLGVKF